MQGFWKCHLVQKIGNNLILPFYFLNKQHDFKAEELIGAVLTLDLIMERAPSVHLLRSPVLVPSLDTSSQLR